MYEKDGEKYFIVDSHSHFWDASRENWVEGREQYAKGWIDCFYGYHQLGPPETHWDWEHYLKVSQDDFERDVFIEGHVDHSIFQSTYLKEWYKNGFNTADQNAALLEKWGDRIIVNGRFDPRDGDEGMKEFEADCAKYQHKGVKLYTAEWERQLPRLQAHRPGVLPLPGAGPGAGHQERPRPQGPDDLAAGQGRVRRRRRRPRGHRLPGSELHRRARRPAAHRGLLLHGGAGAQRLRRPVGRRRRPDARPSEVLRQGDGRAAVLGRRGQDDLRQRLQHLTPKWQVEGLVDWQMPDDDQFADYPRLTTASKKKILGLNAAKLYDIEVPADCRLPDTTADEPMAPGEELVDNTAGAQA